MKTLVWRRYPLAATVLIAWLGGGLLSALVSALVEGQNDTLYAAVHVAAASLAIAAFPVVAPAVAAVHRRHALARPPGAHDLVARPVGRKAPPPPPISVPAQPVVAGARRPDPNRPLVQAGR